MQTKQAAMVTTNQKQINFPLAIPRSSRMSVCQHMSVWWQFLTVTPHVHKPGFTFTAPCHRLSQPCRNSPPMCFLVPASLWSTTEDIIMPASCILISYSKHHVYSVSLLASSLGWTLFSTFQSDQWQLLNKLHI